MITKELLRTIRNDLPMRVMFQRLGRQSPISKEIEGYFRFQCPSCGELRATVNPKNNLAHCFCCKRNWNNIDVLMSMDWDFVAAVEILQGWLMDHQRSFPTAYP
jgi:DNA primase